MKELFKKIFGGKAKKEKDQDPISDMQTELFPKEVNLLTDELFAKNFTENGGRFIYCVNEIELLESLKLIFEENQWDELLSFDNDNDALLKRIGLPFSKINGTNSAFISKCEGLLADNGSVLISSNQTKGRKLIELPYDFIIIASVNDLVKDRSEGLSRINKYYSKNMPSNITTIKGPKTVTGTNNILDTGSVNTSKNIYLLLTEEII